jgi:NADPH-dependent curcumin reductase CurA
MPETRVNRAWRLRSRPHGKLADGDLELVKEAVPELGEGQALVRTKLLSLDPTNRIWMSDIRGYMPPVPIDDVMRGLGIGEVVESRSDQLAVGTLLNGFVGWQELQVVDAAAAPLTPLPDPLPGPEPAFLGALGHTGITAYLGVDFGDLKEGETMVVSAAAGAVGSVAGQIGKARGARVVGIAGGPGKCAHVVEDLGFDACVDHRAEDWRAQLDAATPDGVDVDFENVGGPIMDHVLMRLNIGARISLCGMIAEYNAYTAENAAAGLRNIGQLIMQRATMRGFLVLDHADRYEEAIAYLAGLLAEGKLKYDETIVDGGIEQAPAALAQLFEGSNLGKLLVRVSD